MSINEANNYETDKIIDYENNKVIDCKTNKTGDCETNITNDEENIKAKIRIENIPAGSFAYLGDAVFELGIRTRLIKDYNAMPAMLNKYALSYVNAPSQASFFAAIKPFLTDDELAVFKRARNSKPHSVPKASSPREYRIATGLEAIFGYLHLIGNEKRINELIDIIYNMKCKNPKQ